MNFKEARRTFFDLPMTEEIYEKIKPYLDKDMSGYDWLVLFDNLGIKYKYEDL
jgi:hypothetical protein